MRLRQAQIWWKWLLVVAIIGVTTARKYPVRGQTSAPNGNLVPITAANVANLREISVLDPQAGYPIPTLAWSPDSQTLYMGGKDIDHIYAWDIGNGRLKYS